MAQFGAPAKTEFKVLKPKPNYEFVCVDVQEVPNDSGQFKYDPAKDDPRKATKLKWFFKGRPDTDAAGVTVTKKTGSYLTRDKRNGMLQFCEAIDKDFNIDVAYTSEEDFRNHVVGQSVMLAITNSDGTDKNGDPVVYNNIERAYPSDLPKLDMVEFLKLTGSTVAPDDIPF